jgi:hypothetical protein
MKVIKILMIIFFLQLLLFERNNIRAQWTLEIETESANFKGWDYFRYINVVDSSTVFAFGDFYQIWRRLSDKFWQRITTSEIVGYGEYIAGRNLDNIWITTFITFTPGSNIFRSTNGGFNWTQQINTGGSTQLAFNGIQFSKIHPSYGYAWAGPLYENGSPFKIYKTRDSGNSWIEYTFNYLDDYYGYRPSICITDSNHAWFNFYKDGNYDTVRVLYTTNGGTSFQILKLPLVGYSATALEFKDDNLTGIAFIDAQPNYILRTINGGISWSVNYLPNFLHYIRKLIWIPNSTTWYAAGSIFSGSTNYVYKSTNDGFSWFPMNSFQNIYGIEYMDGISYGNKVYLYAIGNTNNGTNKGRVYRLSETVNTVGVQNQNTTVNDFNLYQNYPNPFNPATKIKFDIPKSALVKLEIYDITGREVITLVNQNLNAGSYEATWNAEGFSSGVYFYNLSTDNFTSVRRMILLK